MKIAGFWVEEEGSGEPLLLVQGLGQSSWVSRFHRAGLATRRRTIAFDNRGTGRSTKDPPYSIEQLADDAASLVGALGVSCAHVLGHSMGGYIAQMLALRHPDLVRSLVLVGTGAGAPTHERVPAATLDVWLANAHEPPETFARNTMFLSFASGWTDEHEDRYEQFLAARLEYPTPRECWRAQYDVATRFVESENAVERIAAQTLVVHGTGDRVVPFANGEALARRIPNARLEVFPGAGHYVMLEQPERFNEVVGSFLDSVEAP